MVPVEVKDGRVTSIHLPSGNAEIIGANLEGLGEAVGFVILMEIDTATPMSMKNSKAHSHR